MQKSRTKETFQCIHTSALRLDLDWEFGSVDVIRQDLAWIRVHLIALD